MRNITTRSPIPISRLRARRQRGNEIIEFAVMAAFLVPTFLWVFVTGMNLVRFTQCTQINRDLGSLYIKGTDYSTYGPQALAVRLSQGYGLNVSSFTGNRHTNNSSTGNGYVVLSQVMYVGPTTGQTCAGVLPSCVNHDSYVYLQRIDFGNVGLQMNGSTVISKLGGSVATATINSSGLVQNYLTDPAAVATNMASLVPSQYADGQVAYIIETFFASPDLGISSMPAGGIYGRTFF